MVWYLLGCGPEVVDNAADRYLEQRPGPEAMVDGDGNYVGGWWSEWTGEVNPEDASGREGALKGWYHFSFNAADYYIVTNLADLNSAANTALLVVDKRTGEFHSGSLRYAFGDKAIEVSGDRSIYENPPDGSFSRDDGGGVYSFGIDVGTMSFTGSAAVRGEEFIQTTRSVDGYGWLQRFPNLEIVEASLDLGDGPVEIAAGTLGLMDWTVGHRSTTQFWNWLSTNGYATDEAGDPVFVSLQIARDQEGADPVIDAQKYGAWVGDDLFKFGEVVFDYEVLDPETGETGPWRIHTPDGVTGDTLDVTFTPQWRRDEQVDFLWYVHTDLRQHYGSLSGTMVREGQTYTLDGLFALAEDSLLTL